MPKQPNIVRIVKLLAEGEYTTKEIASKLEMPLSSATSLISLLACLGIVEKQALKFRGITTISYRLSDYGQEGLDRLKEVKT